ncbi:MAG: 5-formyltetrahydrofolate cyclo-ligase [Parasphingopyxis sp.]|uniref:5-formyltetrahydrofolate cyclo-ligase n=1 Tax=Parasphingopyxis sp. TaxID=1920299 RepID=UPI003FA17FDA
MTKNELRQYFKNKRQGFVSKTKNSDIARQQENLARRLERAQIVTGSVGGYAAMASEFDPATLLSQLEARGHAVALPYFETRESEMEFRARSETLERGPFGVMQPGSDSPAITPDTLFVPLVAADAKGNRIGQGQGHFDRALAKLRANRPITAIGLAWECQIADEIPADPWDEPLDYVATPDRIMEMTS